MNRLTAIGLLLELDHGKNILVVAKSRAHSREMFETVVSTLSTYRIEDLSWQISHGNGSQCIKHVNGCRIDFRAEEPGALRGFAPDIVYLATRYMTVDVAVMKAQGTEVIWD